MTAIDKNELALNRHVYGDEGYFRGIFFSAAELDVLCSIIRAKWLANLVRLQPESLAIFEKTSIEDYHRISHLIDHRSAWGKGARIFSRDEVEKILSLSFFTRLGEVVGKFEVADIEGLGYPEIYWRLVRPNESADVAGAHADAWFYNYTNNLSAAQQEGLVKVWIAVCVEPGESGLAVLPGSHQTEWPNHSEVRDGRPKPVLGVPQDSLGLINEDMVPGEAIVFNTRLLHAGIAHSGQKTRVSMEFAIRTLRD